MRAEHNRGTAPTMPRIPSLSAVVDACPDGIILLELGADAASSRVAYVNPAYAATFGYEPNELIGASLAVLCGPSTDREQLAEVVAHLRAGRPARAELALYAKDGTRAWVEDNLSPMLSANGIAHYAVSSQRDVSDATLRELALATQNDILTDLTSIARELFGALDASTLVDALLVGIARLTGAVGTLYAARPEGGFAQADGLGPPTREAANADSFVEGAAPSPLCVVDDAAQRAAIGIRTRGSIARILVVHAPRGRTLGSEDIFAIGLLAQYFAVAARNVELYLEVEARRAAVQELAAAKSDLVTMLAHDFTGPLTTIVGFAELLAEDPAHSVETRSGLAAIVRSATRLAALAGDTLALSRLEQNEFDVDLEPVDIAQLAREVARAHSGRREVVVVGSARRTVVLADGARLRQVLENLIGNAVKYSPDGAPVHVFVRERAGEMRLTVRDRGIGIPTAERHAIFTRFSRASNARGMGISGSGFGLYLVKLLVERQGGRTWFTSRTGRGSCFSIALPLTSLSDTAGKTRRILLVDRDGDARSFTAHTLRLVNYAVRVVQDVAAARTALATETFEVALFDVDSLEGRIDPAALRGVAVGRVRFIRLAATRGPRLRECWDASLVKPFLTSDLTETIESALDRAGVSA